MKIPGTRVPEKAEPGASEVQVTLAQKLGLIDFLERTSKGIGEGLVAPR